MWSQALFTLSAIAMWCYYRLPYRPTEKSCGSLTAEQQESHQDRNQGVWDFAIHSQLWPQILRAHLAFWDRGTETHLICSEYDFTWHRNIALKLFQKGILLSDSEGGFELWSPRSPSCNLITSNFRENTSGSAGAIPLLINSARRLCLDTWWLGSLSTHAGKAETSMWTSASWWEFSQWCYLLPDSPTFLSSPLTLTQRRKISCESDQVSLTRKFPISSTCTRQSCAGILTIPTWK